MKAMKAVEWLAGTAGLLRFGHLMRRQLLQPLTSSSTPQNFQPMLAADSGIDLETATFAE